MRPTLAACLAALLATVSCAAQAQTSVAAPASETGSVPAASQAPAGLLRTRRTASEGVERRIRELHDKLGITAQQQRAWDAFAAVMRENAAHAAEMRAARRAAALLPAPDDMQRYATAAQSHADDLKRLVPPFQALYASMSAEQKRMADQAMGSFQRRQGAAPAAATP